MQLEIHLKSEFRLIRIHIFIFSKKNYIMYVTQKMLPGLLQILLFSISVCVCMLDQKILQKVYFYTYDKVFINVTNSFVLLF